MSYRSTSPVSGFGGHVPGNKWQVGSKSFNNISNNSQLRNLQIEPEPTIISENNSHTFDFEGNPIPRFSPYFIPPMTPAEYTQYYNQQMANFQAANNGSGSMMQQYSNPIQMYGFNPAFSMNGGFSQNVGGGGMASSTSMQGINKASSQQQISPGNHQNSSVNGQQTRNNDGNSHGQNQQQKARSKSMPRKPKSEVRDMFGGIESGWWSEGQALKNIRRHQQSQAEAASSGNNSNDHISSNSTISAKFRRQDFDEDDVPAPGYSGHIPGIRTHGVGKPFTVAAKESRRIMHSNEINSIQANKGRSDKKDEYQNNSQITAAASRQQFIPPSSMNGFPQQNPQAAFMNSYPFTAAQNGMIQPQQMYMGLPLQGQGQPNLQNNINQSEF
uniref:Uncharacterized protein n=1 Tax=Panagrolaimus sp. PS1159 TaxID=55785 RepID=A0AC35G5Y8_9BILA